MSKEAGFVVPSDHHHAPSAPPSYEEAIQQAAMPMPVPYGPPHPHPVPPMATQYNMPHPPPQLYPPQSIPSHQDFGPRPQEPTTIIVTTVPVGRERCTMRCPACDATILTETKEEAHGFAHACCCLLFFIGCCLCSCLPYCMDSCKTVTHKCPNCHANLGTYSPY